MAQSQRQVDVHQDKLCPPKKRYAFMNANMKVDLDNPLCPNESNIMATILQNNPLRFSIAASSLVPWIYLGQLWHTLKEDGSKYRLKFLLDSKDITMTLNDLRRIFQPPQAIDNNHERFVVAPKFSKMAPFFFNDLGFTLELRSPFNFKMIGLIQPCQKLGKILCIPPRRSTRLTPPTLILTAAESEGVIVQDAIQLSIAEQKSCDDLEANQNEEKVKEHLIAEEIGKMVEGTETVENDKVVNSVLNNQEVPDTRREKGKHIEESRHTPSPTTTKSTRICSTLVSLDTEKLQELMETDPKPSSSTPSSSSPKLTLSMSQHILSLFKPKNKVLGKKEVYSQEVMEEALPNMVDDHVDSSVRNYMTGHILHVHPTQGSQASAQEQQYQLYLTMKDNPQLQHDDLLIWLALKIKFEGLTTSNTPCRSFVICLRDHNDTHDDAHLEGENSAKRQKTSKHETYVFRESSSG
uniref:Uncharacterized protein n=1 Tax=Tanacetum cinerariifolium TaxID=118510 RepID=A0A6L2K637_TANCI|nr:hypothetical protein [Tanacetum cinerariifolium]